VLNQEVLVTTDKDRRGVFFGTLVKHDEDQQTVELKNARMAVYWSSKAKGVLGLAAIGPQAGSRVTPEVPAITLNGVTSVTLCTNKAARQWKKDIWD